MSKLRNFTGEKIGRLTVIQRVPDERGRILWECKCDCGNTSYVTSDNLSTRHTKSCGCLLRERSLEANVTHGGTHSRLYRLWAGMKRRCYNTNDISYPNYGGRGITVCEEWHDFSNFRKWANESGYDESAPRELFSLDRIDVNENYCSDNCRWVTIDDQKRNKRNTVYIEYKNQRHTAKEWSIKLDIPYKRIMDRIYKGFSPDKVLNRGDLR
jgi:hypothetical protein